MLGSQSWSFNGGNDAFNATYLQPFLSYTTKKHTGFSLNTESTYDWISDQWTVPINLGVSQLVKIGKLPVQFQLGGRWYAEAPTAVPIGVCASRSLSSCPNIKIPATHKYTKPLNS